MNNSDYEKFSEMWVTAHELSVNGKVLSDSAMYAAFNSLADFDIGDISQALTKHTRSNKFAPTPACIRGILSAGSNHIGADEAWALALKSMDENETVIWTQQIADARAIALNVWNEGDKVAARMTFKDAYTRSIENAPPPKWIICIGHDRDLKVAEVKKAVELGLIEPPKWLEFELLPPPSPQRLLGRMEERVRLAAQNGEIVDEIVKAKGHLSKLKIMLERSMEETLEEGIARREAERIDFENKKQAQLDLLNKKSANQ
jgi:hypothetical protein